MLLWRLLLAKPEWGTKRTCQSCGARFYDLGRSPAVCPSCGATLDIEALTRARRPRPAVRAVPAAAVAAIDDPEVETGTPDLEDAEDAAEIGEEEEEEGIEAEEGADEDEEGLIEDASELGDDEDVSDVIEGDIDEEAR